MADKIIQYIKNQKGLNERQKALLLEKSQQTWFRQYAKQSTEHLKKLTKTVKEQIKKNKGIAEYYKENRNPDEDKRGKIKPKVKERLKKEEIKKEVKKQKTEKKQKMSDKQKKQKRKEYRKAYNQRPDVKKYNRERKRRNKK